MLTCGLLAAPLSAQQGAPAGKTTRDTTVKSPTYDTTSGGNRRDTAQKPSKKDSAKAPRAMDTSKASRPADSAKASRPVDTAKTSRPADTSKASRPADTAKAAPTTGKGRGFSQNPLWSGMNLTKEQRVKIDSLHMVMVTGYNRNLAAIQGIRDSIRQQLEAATPDTARLNQYERRLGDDHARLSQLGINQLLQLKATLTPEQFKKLLDREWQRPQPIKGRLGSGRYGYFNWDAQPLEENQ
jgi:Spy/CpxP family protein refolding chaperone